MMALFKDRIGFTKLEEISCPPPNTYRFAVPIWSTEMHISLNNPPPENTTIQVKTFWFIGYENNMAIYEEIP